MVNTFGEMLSSRRPRMTPESINRQISLNFEQKSLTLVVAWLQIFWLSSSADTESTSASQSAAH